MAKSSFPFKIFRSIYKNEFQWMLVKSYGLFFLGVFLAKELTGLELMPV
ncbi:uncharacterized protein [Drosophila kikkawai]|uniref:Uncharacterized protein n=1 Tax=Drosophila kikkawai TaxID=30033 RepID=A0A6P4JMQ3_DROKI|nr:uncharacterized protein LOC108084302 [Drosophila kikkawai]